MPESSHLRPGRACARPLLHRALTACLATPDKTLHSREERLQYVAMVIDDSSLAFAGKELPSAYVYKHVVPCDYSPSSQNILILQI